MSKVRIAAFSISLDGFGAGPRQDLNNPLGVRGLELHQWFFNTEAFKKMHGQTGGTQGIDNDFGLQSFENIGAWILGRNMFSPVRGPWESDSWKGWWGDNPPYHTPVFVLTHHPRPSLTMEGGTTFHLRHRRPGSRSPASQRSSQRQRRPHRRRRLRHPSVSGCRPDRRDSFSSLSGPPRRRRTSLLRNQSPQTRFRPNQNSPRRKRYPRSYQKNRAVTTA
jgi:dihydrofolate reductase